MRNDFVWRVCAVVRHRRHTESQEGGGWGVRTRGEDQITRVRKADRQVYQLWDESASVLDSVLLLKLKIVS